MTKDDRQNLMREAMDDEMFVADLKEVMDDFQHADFEELKSLDEVSSDAPREAALRMRAMRDRMPVLDVSIKDLIEEGRYR